MAMTMTGEVTLPADRPKVWAMLNDPAVLKASIPGCQSLEKTSDTSFAAVVKVKIGPVGASFKGKVQLSDIDPPNGYTIGGEGEGGIAGFANGGAKVQLADAPEGTLLNMTSGQCRRQDRATRLAADRRRRQEDGRSVLRQSRQGGGRARRSLRRRRSDLRHGAIGQLDLDGAFGQSDATWPAGRIALRRRRSNRSNSFRAPDGAVADKQNKGG